ncbi:hypothetical protein D9M70_539310 [compost metagenome]
MDEFAIQLIQPVPALRVLLHAIGQGGHFQLGCIQRLQELRSMIQRQIDILEMAEPMALAPLTHRLLDIGSSRRSGNSRANQLTEDLAVYQLKVIEIKEGSIIELMQLVTNL